MPEGEVSLGAQRLGVSRALGSEFVRQLESDAPSSRLTELVRERLLENSHLQILGIRLLEDSQAEDTEASLVQQMGLPPSANLGSVADRLEGGEGRYLLVVSGIGNLPSNKEGKLKKQLSKLGVETVFG